MNINDFDELVKKQNKNVITKDYRIGVSGFDDEVKKLNKDVLYNTFRSPPGYIKQEEERIDPVFGKPTYLSQGTLDTREEDTAFTRFGRIVLPQSLETAFGIDETQRKPRATTAAEDIQMIGNAQTIEMARRNPEMVGDLEYLKSAISFGNNLTKYLPGYEYDIAPSDLPEPVKTSQHVAYGVGSLLIMVLAQPLIESAFVSMVTKIPGGASMISKVSEAARLSPWKIGYPMAITKAGFIGGLFGLITENKKTVAENVLVTGGTFAAFTAIAFPVMQFFRPILEKVGSSTMTPDNSRKIANDALNAIKTQETTGTIWFRNPNDSSQLLKVTATGIESVNKNAPGVIPKGIYVKDISVLSKLEIEAFKENPSLYGKLKEWLGGKKINVPFEPPVSVPNVEVPPVKAEVPTTTVEISKTKVPTKTTTVIPVAPTVSPEPIQPKSLSIDDLERKIEELEDSVIDYKELDKNPEYNNLIEQRAKAYQDATTQFIQQIEQKVGTTRKGIDNVFNRPTSDIRDALNSIGISDKNNLSGFSSFNAIKNIGINTDEKIKNFYNGLIGTDSPNIPMINYINFGPDSSNPWKGMVIKTEDGSFPNKELLQKTKEVFNKINNFSLTEDTPSIDQINASKPEGNEPFAITPTVKDRTPFAITPSQPAITSTEPFIPKEDISGEQVSRNLELIAEDINQKIQEKADEMLANIEKPTQIDKEKALDDAKKLVKNYIEMQGEKIQRPDILVSKTQVKEMVASLEQDIIEMKAILKDNKKYLHFQQKKGGVNTDMLLKPSALGLVEGNIKIGDTLKIDIKKLKPKGTSMRAVDSDGNIMASKGSQPIGKFKQQTTTPEKSVADSFKLFEKVNEMIKKYAERVGEQYLPRGAKGVYYHGSTKNIRLTSMNELSVAAHEISHYLDEQFNLTSKFMGITGYSSKGNPIYDSATAPIRKELTKIYTNYYHGGKDDHKLSKRMSEGFATLIQKYVEMPTTMEQNFPNAVKQILKPGGEFYNDTIGQMLGDLKKIVVDYQALSELDQIGAVVTSDKNKTGKESFLNFFQKIRTEVADEIYPIEVLGQIAGVGMTVNDPSLWLRMYGLSNSYIINNLSGDKGFWRFKNGDLVKTNDSNWKNLLDRLKKEKSFDSFGHFLVGRDQHFQFKELEKLKETSESNALEYKNASRDINAESSPEDIADLKSLKAIANKSKQAYEELKVVLDKNGIVEQTATKAYEENLERFKEETELFDQLTREDVEFAHDKMVRMLNDEKYKEFTERKGHASLKREFYDDILGDTESTSKTPSGTKVSTFKKRTGSSRTILHPIESAIKTHAEITKKGLKQMVYNSIGDNIAKQFPKLFQIQQLQTIPDKNTGGFIFPQEKDPNIIMAIGKDGKRVPILTDKYVKSIIDDILTYQDVHILEKVLIKMSRIFTKGTTAAYPPFLIANTSIDAISSTIQTQTKMVPIYSALKEFYKVISDKDSLEAQLFTKYLVSGGDRQTLSGYQNMSANELLEAITRERDGILKVLDIFNSGVDILSIPSKYSEIFTRATEYIRSIKQGNPHIVALEHAGRVSAPFHHIGRLGGGRFGKTAVKTIPFFNPAIQVLDQTARTFETPEGRKRAYFVMAVLATLMAAGTASIVVYGTEKQKRLLADIDPEELNMYIHYPNTDGETLGKLRIPQNYSWLGGILNMGIIDKKLNTHYSTLDYINTASSVIPNQFQPWNAEWIFSILPQGLKVPILKATDKKDFPKIMDIESQGQKNKEPGLRYTDETSLLAKWLGKEFNLSPLKTDALITGILGRASGFVTIKPSAYSIKSSISRSEYFDSGRAMQLYYETKKENDLKTKSVKNRLREFTPEEKAATLKLNNTLSQIDGLVERYRKVDEEKNPEQSEQLKQSIYQLINEKLR